MKRFAVLSIFTFFLLPALLPAQSGQAGLSFLKNGVGARTVGMGDVGVAGAADMGTAMYYNPALLADDTDASITIMHNEWIQDITTEYIGISIPLRGWTFGLFMGLTSVEGIEVRDRPTPEPIATTDSRNFAGGISAAFQVMESVSVGFNAKYIFEKIHVDDAGGYAFDFGLAAHPFTNGQLQNLGFGLALANLGSMSELASTETTLPLLLRYGAGYAIPVTSLKSRLNIEVNGVTLLEEETTHANIGLEFDYVDMVFARIGYQSGYDNKNVSFGAGARYSTLRFDYAFVPFSESFGNAHTVALSITL
ncbi:MAG: PorV/PorQ family protein [Bacteroidetes bacterium]|nr:PorV/PorQ family protein [Bacteroidota bacterium]